MTGVRRMTGARTAWRCDFYRVIPRAVAQSRDLKRKFVLYLIPRIPSGFTPETLGKKWVVLLA